MARSPLLRRFQALFEDFDEAERSGHSVKAVQEERRQMRLTRRDFLKVTGATVGAAAFAWPIAGLGASTTPLRNQGRIAIIGGGISWLKAGPSLQDWGRTTLRSKASDRGGGLMNSSTRSNCQTSER